MLLLWLCGTRILGIFLCHIFYICPQRSLLISIFWYPKEVLLEYIHWCFQRQSDTALTETMRWRERESRHISINLVKDWYLTQQCSQTDVKDYIISMSLISGILFFAALLYLLVCGLFCSFLERRILRTRTEKKPGKSRNWLCMSVLWQPTISPVDDLQIPGRCVVESQRTGTRTTRSNCFLWKHNVSTRFMLS